SAMGGTLEQAATTGGTARDKIYEHENRYQHGGRQRPVKASLPPPLPGLPSGTVLRRGRHCHLVSSLYGQVLVSAVAGLTSHTMPAPAHLRVNLTLCRSAPPEHNESKNYILSVAN